MLNLHDESGELIVGTTSGGADSWSDELAEYLRYKKIIVMPDSDEAGKKYMQQIVQSLKKRNIDHRVVTFEDVGAKDVSEFLEQGHTVTELAERIGLDWAHTGAKPVPATVVVEAEKEAAREQYVI